MEKVVWNWFWGLKESEVGKGGALRVWERWVCDTQP